VPIAGRIHRRRPVEGAGPRKLDLRLQVKNFGPVFEGDIQLKPLTVFVGPNNSGKSYIAMLVHSIFEAHPMGREAKYAGSGTFGMLQIIEDSSQQYRDLLQRIKSLKAGEALELDSQTLDHLIRDFFSKIYEKRLSDEIARAYACTVDKLVSLGRRNFEIKLHTNSRMLSLKSIHTDIKAELPDVIVGPTLLVKCVDRGGYVAQSRGIGQQLLVEVNKPFLESETSRPVLTQIIFHDLLETCCSEIFSNLSLACYYLPAARSGILQGHKVLTASMWRQLPLIGIKQMDIPTFSGVVSEFVSRIISLPDEPGPFFKLAQEFENELIRGEISIKTLDKARYPDIVYKFRDLEIPLHRTSSSVSELAPLFLYLKYILEPGDVLIIEEPEAHLHPANQAIIARFLTKLIRNGLNIIITTHSDFLIQQLNTFILLGEKKKRPASLEKSGENEFLSHDEVAAVVFDYNPRKDAYKVRSLEVGPEEGISQEQFMNVHEALYEESFRIKREIFSENDSSC
jgi:predicted ATPase